MEQVTHEQLNRYLSYLEQDEGNLTLLVKISDLYSELNDFRTAQAYLDKANAINRIACLGHQGLLDFNQGKFSEAQANLLEALAHEETPALRYNLGLIYFITSELESAKKILSPLENSREYPEVNVLIARICHSEGELEKAITLCEKIIFDTPDHAEALGLMALLHFDMDEGNLALQFAQQALASHPENYDAKLVLLLLGLPDKKTTVEEVETLLQINPGDCRLWFALGNVHMTEGAFDVAEYSLQKALAIYPEFYDCHTILGWCFLMQNKLSDALHTYQTAAEIIPELADAWAGIALVYALQENFIETKEYIAKADTLSTDCFLNEIAKVIFFIHENPLTAQKHLVETLKNTDIAASEKLAYFIEEMQVPSQLH